MAKQEVRRGRKFVEYHDPDTQDPHTFTQEISGADVSYQDESGSWLPADENWQTDGADGFILKNDKLNHKIRLKGTGGRTWYPRRNVSTEYLTFGIPQFWDGKRWKNFGFSGYSVEGKTITLNTRQGVTILVHNRWNGIKIDWILTSSSAPSRMRYPVSLTGITYVDGIIYGADGTRLGQLTPTTATDANEAELVCSGSYSGGYVEFQADVTGASFPVTIDPDFSTTSTAGDTYLNSYYTTRNWGAATAIAISGSNRALFKFDCSSVAAGSTPSAANIKITKSDFNDNSRVVTIYWRSVSQANGDWIEGTGSGTGNAASGEPCFTAKVANGSGGVTTAWAGSNGLNTAITDYETDVLASGTANRQDAANTQYTYDLNAAGLARIAGWFGAVNTNYGLRVNASDDHGSYHTSEAATESYRPVLTITYTAAGGFHPINMSAQMSNLTGGMRS
jgi:hypothetical protein